MWTWVEYAHCFHLSNQVPKGELPLPILRYCKTNHHADILIPYIHFQTKRYNASLLSQIDNINRHHVWPRKRDVVFGRFTT